MIEPEIAFADLSDNAALAEALLKYTFAAPLNERQEDLAFFDQRIEKGLVAKLEGIVGSEFAHMDYGEAIQVLERANEKFEFPVKWGIDLQSEHERYLTEKHGNSMASPSYSARWARGSSSGRWALLKIALAAQPREPPARSRWKSSLRPNSSIRAVRPQATRGRGRLFFTTRHLDRVRR
jgi:hypothetical protein